MSYSRQATRYRETEVLTATPGQLVVLLYDHLLLSLRRARTAMDSGDLGLQSESLEKAELFVTLDRERGGEVAANLGALYSFLLGELVQVGIRSDAARLDRVAHMIGELREAFAQVASTAVVGARSA